MSTIPGLSRPKTTCLAGTMSMSNYRRDHGAPCSPDRLETALDQFGSRLRQHLNLCDVAGHQPWPMSSRTNVKSVSDAKETLPRFP